MNNQTKNIEDEVIVKEEQKPFFIYRKVVKCISDGISFYTDNFFSLLPNESKTIIIDTRMEDMPSSASFVIKGWNVIERNYVIMQNRY